MQSQELDWLKSSRISVLPSVWLKPSCCRDWNNGCVSEWNDPRNVSSSNGRTNIESGLFTTVSVLVRNIGISPGLFPMYLCVQKSGPMWGQCCIHSKRMGRNRLIWQRRQYWFMRIQVFSFCADLSSKKTNQNSGFAMSPHIVNACPCLKIPGGRRHQRVWTSCSWDHRVGNLLSKCCIGKTQRRHEPKITMP
jgi:hypothetical protein